MNDFRRHVAGGLNEKPKGVRRMNTAASEWAAYVAARNRIETAKAAREAALSSKGKGVTK